MNSNIKKIMIFGRPGSGKSSFALDLSENIKLPLYHLDKYFFEDNWIERNYQEFLEIQNSIVEKEGWIIDGNSIRSLEMRYSKADIVFYFNYPRLICLYRLFKRLFHKNSKIDDRAKNCSEIISWKLVKYMWKFDERIKNDLKKLQNKYPKVKFMEIKSDKDLHKVRI